MGVGRLPVCTHYGSSDHCAEDHGTGSVVYRSGNGGMPDVAFVLGVLSYFEQKVLRVDVKQYG